MKGEGGDETQSRQYSMEEEITQETAGKHAFIVHLSLCVSLQRNACIVCLIGYVWVFVTLEIPVPDIEIEKEEDTSEEPAQTPAEESLKVWLGLH